jgi:hypothetical protein
MRTREEGNEKERWRWEFMRQNEEVREDYKKILHLKKKFLTRLKKAKFKGDAWTEWDKNPPPPERQEERRLMRKHGISGPFFPDPNKSYDEIIAAQKKVDAETARRFFGHIIGMYGGVTITYPDDPNHLIIDIHFDQVNKISEAKKFIKERIDRQMKYLGAAKTRRNDNKDYRRILDVGKKAHEMYKGSEIGYEIIAARLLLDKYNEKGKAGSATKTVENLAKEYERLINGGYKEIC